MKGKIEGEIELIGLEWDKLIEEYNKLVQLILKTVEKAYVQQKRKVIWKWINKRWLCWVKRRELKSFWL